MNAPASFPQFRRAKNDDAVPSIKRLIKAMPLTAQIALIQSLVDADDFAPFDDDTLFKLDEALGALHSQSVADDRAEDLALHGAEVAA